MRQQLFSFFLSFFFFDGAKKSRTHVRAGAMLTSECMHSSSYEEFVVCVVSKTRQVSRGGGFRAIITLFADWGRGGFSISAIGKFENSFEINDDRVIKFTSVFRTQLIST